jgi:hypothetical protein
MGSSQDGVDTGDAGFTQRQDHFKCRTAPQKCWVHLFATVFTYTLIETKYSVNAGAQSTKVQGILNGQKP